MDSIDKNKVKVVVDSREERSGIINLLKNYNLEIIKKNLAIGDYFIDDRILVERKTICDFKDSLINGRLFEQLGSLKKWCDKSLVIIEGDLSTIEGIDSNALQGAIVSIAVFWQIPILFSKDLEESAKLLYIIVSQLVKNKKRKAVISYPKRRFAFSESYGQRMLEVLPYVGSLTAKNLIRHFGNIENVIKSSEQELAEIKGIGLTKARRIKNIFQKNTGTAG